jgi:hypothetical protein
VGGHSVVRTSLNHLSDIAPKGFSDSFEVLRKRKTPVRLNESLANGNLVPESFQRYADLDDPRFDGTATFESPLHKRSDDTSPFRRLLDPAANTTSADVRKVEQCVLPR